MRREPLLLKYLSTSSLWGHRPAPGHVNGSFVNPFKPRRNWSWCWELLAVCILTKPAGLSIFQMQAIPKHSAFLRETVINCCSDLMMSPGIMIYGEGQTAGSHIFQRRLFSCKYSLLYTRKKVKMGGGGWSRTHRTKAWCWKKNVFHAVACSLWKEGLPPNSFFSFINCIIKQNDKSSKGSGGKYSLAC